MYSGVTGSLCGVCSLLYSGIFFSSELKLIDLMASALPAELSCQSCDDI